MRPLDTYLTSLREIRSSGEAVDETSYYGALESLLNEIGKSLKPKVRCVLQLKNRGMGNPDGGLDPQITKEFNCLQKSGQFCALASGTYRVLNQESGLFWDDPTLASGPVPQEPLNPGSTGASQQWTFTLSVDGTYRITNKANGLVLTDPLANGAPGKHLVLAPFDGGSNQKWIVTPLNNGYRITNVFTQLTADATTAVPSQGTSIVHATPTGDSEQVWVIR